MRGGGRDRRDGARGADILPGGGGCDAVVVGHDGGKDVIRRSAKSDPIEIDGLPFFEAPPFGR